MRLINDNNAKTMKPRIGIKMTLHLPRVDFK